MMGLPWGFEGLRRGFWRDLPSLCAQPRWPPQPFDSRDVALAQGGQPTFRTGTEIVSFGVTVTDKRANFLNDLTRDDFEIFEDGKKQTIEYFARGDEDSGPELHIGLLFDTSGSMDADIKLSRSAAVKFLNTLSDAKDITLVDFDTEVRVAKYGQQDFPRLVERIRSRKPSGFTAMYDALGVYLDSAAEDQGRKILVLFTDGGDTRSTIRFGDVLTLVRASDVTVYAVGFLENQPSSVRAEQRLRLTQLRPRAAARPSFPYADEADRGGLRQDPHADPRAVQPRLRLHEHRDRRQLAESRDQGPSPGFQGSARPVAQGLLRAVPEVDCGSVGPISPKPIPSPAVRSMPCLPSTINSSWSATSRSAATRSAPCRSSSRD